MVRGACLSWGLESGVTALGTSFSCGGCCCFSAVVCLCSAGCGLDPCLLWFESCYQFEITKLNEFVRVRVCLFIFLRQEVGLRSLFVIGWLNSGCDWLKPITGISCGEKCGVIMVRYMLPVELCFGTSKSWRLSPGVKEYFLEHQRNGV